jgi:xanthine dehydrogenase accessory factor
MTGISLWQFIERHITTGDSVMLLCVVESAGSSPGRRGFKMAVCEKEICGSIGGGVMEHKLVELAKEKLRTGVGDAVLRKQLHNKSAAKDQSGMICSGEQTIVMYKLTINDLATVKNIIESLSRFSSGHIVLSQNNFEFHDAEPATDFSFVKTDDLTWRYIELTGHKSHLYIIGGGHCSLAFSQLMHSMDFYIHIFEERKDLNTLSANKFAHEKTIVNDYSKLSSLIESGQNNYVVVMTFGYRTDDVAVRSLISKNFKYFGVLGSKSKIEKMMSEWRRDNLPEEKLKLLHAPIGVQIKSETPMEIAVSIAAEIISVKNQN